MIQVSPQFDVEGVFCDPGVSPQFGVEGVFCDPGVSPQFGVEGCSVIQVSPV